MMSIRLTVCLLLAYATKWAFGNTGAAEYALHVANEQKERSNYDDETLRKFQNTLKAMEILGQFKFKGKYTGAEPPLSYDIGAEGEQEEIGRGAGLFFESDIVLTVDQMKEVVTAAEADVGVSDVLDQKPEDIEKRKKRKLTSRTRLRWRMPINYRIDTSSGVDAAAVERAINLWRSSTCLRFQRINSGSGNYMEFFKGSGCYSNVGMVGGRQTVSIGRGCTKIGIVAHEIGHALGFWHEQSRPDRDSYITINSGSIRSGTLGNFLKRSPGDVTLMGIPFDMGSVMHYGPTAFATSRGAITIGTKDPNFQHTIGQRDGLSFYDIKFINKAYCSTVCTRQLACQHNGYPDPKNCNVCRCPDGFGGNLCEKAKQFSSSCGQVDLTATPTYKTISNSGRTRCNWHIKSPSGRKVLIEVQTFAFRSATTCTSDYLEIKTSSDLANTGARMCKSRPTRSFRSLTNEAMIIFNGNGGRFSLRYRQDPPDTVVPTPGPITRPTRPPPPGPTADPFTTTRAPRPTGWAEWSAWSKCSKDCGGCGTRRRQRICLATGTCPGKSSEFEKCNFKLCTAGAQKLCSRLKVVPCGLRRWCTKRVQVPCTKDASSGDQTKQCCAPYKPQNNRCVIGGTVTKPTPATPRPTTPGPKPRTTTPTSSVGWHQWSPWTPCQVSKCGGCGRRYRARGCRTGRCSGPSVVRERCNFTPCSNCNSFSRNCPCCSGMSVRNGQCSLNNDEGELETDTEFFSIDEARILQSLTFLDDQEIE